VSIIVGVPLGIIAAVRQYSALDYGLTAFSAAFISIPGFVLALAGIYLFAVTLRILPANGMLTLGQPFSPIDLARHMLLPMAILSLFTASQLMRYTRAAMLDVLGSDYVTTAHAKGVSSRTVLRRHAFRNALIPVITVIGLTLPELVAGAVITEQIFGWPGMGQMAVGAASNRDPAVMMGVILIVAVAVLVSNLVADVAYAVADPRVRLDRAPT
jgi:peptide/nickel transport system permease protein